MSAQAGMTYVELIVVLSIFAIMSTIIFFNYGEFQAKVDIKSLASDIALKIVQAQKSAVNGVLPSLSQQSSEISGWKPAYGVYFNSSTTNDIPNVPFNKEFIYFTDLNQNGIYDASNCPGSSECLDRVTITKNNSILSIDQCDTLTCIPSSPISITFKRPDSSAIFHLGNALLTLTGSQYIQITIKSPKTAMAKIKIYPSGRIQVN